MSEIFAKAPLTQTYHNEFRNGRPLPEVQLPKGNEPAIAHDYHWSHRYEVIRRNIPRFAYDHPLYCYPVYDYFTPQDTPSPIDISTLPPKAQYEYRLLHLTEDSQDGSNLFVTIDKLTLADSAPSYGYTIYFKVGNDYIADPRGRVVIKDTGDTSCHNMCQAIKGMDDQFLKDHCQNPQAIISTLISMNYMDLDGVWIDEDSAPDGAILETHTRLMCLASTCPSQDELDLVNYIFKESDKSPFSPEALYCGLVLAGIKNQLEYADANGNRALIKKAEDRLANFITRLTTSEPKVIADAFRVQNTIVSPGFKENALSIAYYLNH